MGNGEGIEREKNKWGRGEGKPVVKSRRLLNTLGKLVFPHRQTGCLQLLETLDIYWNSKCFLEILEISWNLTAPPGDFCIFVSLAAVQLFGIG